MTESSHSDRLTDLLSLEHAPIAITLHSDGRGTAPAFDEPMSTPTADRRSGRVGASCVFWARARDNTFSTVAEDHGNCSVGVFTHGFGNAEDIVQKSDVGTLLDVGWVTLEAFAEVAAIPTAPSAIEYGPLSEADSVPDVVLLRLNARQMMELADAVPVEFSGKPQCQIIPRAAAGAISASMGCALSRERIGLDDHELTCAIPGQRLAEVVDALDDVCRADAAVVGYAVADAVRFERSTSA